MERVLAASSAIESIKHAINVLCQPHWFLIISVIALIVFLVGYRTLTKPPVAAGIGLACVLFFMASCFDSDFFKIVSKGDNVPIVMMMAAIGFTIWLAFRQSAINDERMEQGEPLIEAGAVGDPPGENLMYRPVYMAIVTDPFGVTIDVVCELGV